jgi:phosphonoacetaldehyde hydrolase
MGAVAIMIIKAIILDWAGTTVDYGSRAPTLAFREVFKREGVPIKDLEARTPMGKAKRDHIAAIAAMPRVVRSWKRKRGSVIGKEDIDRMYERFLPIQKELLLTHSDVIPGVVEAIRQCREWGIKIGSTTGYSRELMEVVAPIAAAQGYSPDVIVCADDVAKGRPSPQMNLRAAELLGVPPSSEVLVLDDTTVGCEAGKRAGCIAVGVSKTGNMLGMTLQEIEAEDPEEMEDALIDVDWPLREAGARFVIPAVADLPDLIQQIEDDYQWRNRHRLPAE